MTDFPVLATVQRAWKDIEFYCQAEVHEHWLDVRVYKFFFYLDPGQQEWDGVSPLEPDKPPEGCAFERDGSSGFLDFAHSVTEAQVYLHGSLKWDGCCNLYFDQQDKVMLHFCGKKEAENIGVLLGRLYDLAKELVPAYQADFSEE